MGDRLRENDLQAAYNALPDEVRRALVHPAILPKQEWPPAHLIASIAMHHEHGSAEFDADSIGEKRGLRFDLPGRKDKVPPREGTRRARLLELLVDAGADGVDFFQLHEQMQKEGTACGNLKSLRDTLGLLSRKNGYAVVGTDANLKLKRRKSRTCEGPGLLARPGPFSIRGVVGSG